MCFTNIFPNTFWLWHPKVSAKKLPDIDKTNNKVALRIVSKASLDNLKLANKLAEEISKKEKKIKIFIQINLGGEKQKSGIEPSELELFYKNCCQLKLNIIGTMCIPPESKDPSPYFKNLLELNQKIGLSEISMGMTNDYLKALEYKSTFLRIGTGIFGKRTN